MHSERQKEQVAARSEHSSGNVLPGQQAAVQLWTNHGWQLGRVKVRPKPPRKARLLAELRATAQQHVSIF